MIMHADVGHYSKKNKIPKRNIMEIHNHPKRLKKKKKQIKEYIFEFLVIFIAIIGSFFAENLRDSFMDKKQVKEYMERLQDDLRADTTNIARTILMINLQSNGLDSLIKTMKYPLEGSNQDRFYELSQKYASSYFGYTPVSTAMTQLMSTGSLRLVKKRDISEGIINYDKAKNDVIKIGEFTGKQISEIIDQQAEIIDFLGIYRLPPNTDKTNQVKKSIIFDSNEIYLSEYFYKLLIYKSSIYLNRSQLTELKNQGTLLIKLIQKEYDLN
jgi:hypothetical protein